MAEAIESNPSVIQQHIVTLVMKVRHTFPRPQSGCKVTTLKNSTARERALFTFLPRRYLMPPITARVRSPNPFAKRFRPLAHNVELPNFDVALLQFNLFTTLMVTPVMSQFPFQFACLKGPQHRRRRQRANTHYWHRTRQSFIQF